MTTPDFILNVELPKHGVSEALRPHLIRYLLQGGFSYGDPFLSDRDLVEATGRSRSAIRLAFDLLQKDGWIERRSGTGTFVGPRIKTVKAAELSHLESADKLPDDKADSFDKEKEREHFEEDGLTPPDSSLHKLLRLAIVTSGIERVGYNSWWLAPQLRGIDSVSEKYGITVEFLGDHTAKPRILSRRFQEHRPDVLVSSGSPLHHMRVFGEAQRYQIPCLLCAVRTPELDIPNIVDDAENAIADAVQYLYTKGHRRIAYVSLMVAQWWTFDRYAGYQKGLERCGLEHDELALWLPKDVNESSAAKLKAFLDQEEPTAVIFSSFWASANMQWLTGHHGLHVGRDLSVVAYDQHPEATGWFGGVKPTVITPPLYEMGKLMGEYARRAVEGQDIPPLSILPCTLIEGDSVKDLNSST